MTRVRGAGRLGERLWRLSSVDAVVGQLIMVPRIADESKHKVTKAALAGLSRMFVLLGCAFCFEAMP